MIGMNNIPAWVSAGAATLSLIFTVVSWYLSNKSKKAKEKAEAAHQATLDMCTAVQRSAQAAEERVEQVEKSLEQMKQIVTEQQSQSQSQSKIAASLLVPEFELTHVGGDATFSLRNVTMGPIKVLDVVNSYQFEELDREEIVKEFQSREMVKINLNYCSGDDNLRLRIEGRDNILCVPIERNPNLLQNRSSAS
ncbi:hypothetical protein [Rothia sp. HMSC061C12]|jgi:hypothetical protein|uniref:hypothetical protein n=2 Tax=Rothia TaxID=32207 RepID=UPI00114D1645|nr:hypothetical protein [Rothia sp. HMSC061C12]